MQDYLTNLTARNKIARETMAFHLERPDGFDFTPGQFFWVNLIEPERPDKKDNRRHFSIASPVQNSTEIIFATRLTGSGLKKNLLAMPLGSKIRIQGPLGNFTLPEDKSNPVVMLAGGIGITPFRSMILSERERDFPRKINLFHSNRTPADAPFLDELTNLSTANFNFIPTITRPADTRTSWNHEEGRIDAAMLGRHLDQLDKQYYFLAGPPNFTQGMFKLLKNELTVPEEIIMYEEFTGY